MEIFQYWHDQWNVPEYIQMCMASVRRHHAYVTQLDRRDYIDVCKSVGVSVVDYGKYGSQTERIVHQVETNILRCLLLSSYTDTGGAAWIDADTLCIAPLTPFFEMVPSDKIGAIKYDEKKPKVDNNVLFVPGPECAAARRWKSLVYAGVNKAVIDSERFAHVMVGEGPLNALYSEDIIFPWSEKEIMWGRAYRDKWLDAPKPEHQLSDAPSVNFVNSINKEKLGVMTRAEIMGSNTLARNIFMQAGF